MCQTFPDYSLRTDIFSRFGKGALAVSIESPSSQLGTSLVYQGVDAGYLLQRRTLTQETPRFVSCSASRFEDMYMLCFR